MADFDPYHKWLGIPPKDQPPHHYRLLGVELFESDSDVIDAAANKQMAYLQSCANGPKLVISQRLLNEIAAARLCLLNAKQKTAYDVTLKAKLAEQELRKSASASASASKADSSKEPVAEREVEGSQFDFNAEEPFEIHDLIREASTGRLSRIKPTHFFIPKLLVVTLLVCIAAGLLIRFGNSNEKPATTDEVAGQSSSTSQDRQRVPNKSPNDRRPSSAKPGPSVTSTERATVNKESQHASPNSSSLSSEQITNSIGMKLTLIPAGEFMMGTSEQSTIRFSDESPQHLVKVSKPFYLGIYEVTQREYAALLSGLNPSIVRNETLPVNNVDWDDAANFCRRLSDKEQRAYRLPTEAEWEYACRAGNNDWLQQSKISEFGWHSDNAKQQPHPVGSLKPNPFGLFDMFGNVSEWCHDWYFSGYYADSPTLNPAGPISGSSRISRGGNWDDSTDRCRRAYRGASSPTHRSERLGFRVLLETGAHRESALLVGPPKGPVAKTPTPQSTTKRKQGTWIKLFDTQMQPANADRVKLKDGVLEIDNTTVSFPEIRAKDVILRGKVKKLSREKHVTLTVRQSVDGHYHGFYWFNSAGQGPGIAKTDNGSWKDLKNDLNNIRTKFGSDFTEMSMEASGNALRFFVGGQLVVSLSDKSFSEGSVSVSSYLGKAQFKDLEVMILDR